MAKTFLLALVAGLLTATISLSWTSLAINDQGTLRIQDFAHQFLLVNAKASVTSEYPYSPERRASVIHKVCQEIVDQNCEAPKNPHPMGISPAGLSIFKALGFTFGHDLNAAFHAYILVVFFTIFTWLALFAELWPKRRARLLAISAWTVTSVSKSAFLAILQGQFSLLIAGAIGLALTKTGPHANAWRVIALVFSAIKPSYAVCVFPIVVALRDTRSLALATAAIIALLCSSMCIYGPGIVIDYPGVLLSYSQGMNFSWYTNPVHIGSLIPIDRQLLSMFGISIAVIFTFAGLYFRKMSLASCATIGFLLTAPYVGPYELVLFFLPVVALEADMATRSTPPDSAHPGNS